MTLPSDALGLAAEYYYFTIDDPAASTLRFRNGFDDGAWPTARVTGWVRLEGKEAWEQPEDWTRLPEKLYCRDLQRERVAEIVVIVSNSEWQNRSHRLEPARPPQLSVSNVGCAGWSGSVRYSYSSEEEYVAKWVEEYVTDVTFRPAEWLAEWPEERRAGLYMLPEPTVMRARFSGYAWDDSYPPRQCTYDASFNFPILTDQSALSLAIDGSLSYGGRGWITPVETIDINDSCGPTTLHVDLRDWWKSAVTVEEADALFVAPDGRTISGSYTNGAGGVYRWELKALPRE